MRRPTRTATTSTILCHWQRREYSAGNCRDQFVAICWNTLRAFGTKDGDNLKDWAISREGRETGTLRDYTPRTVTLAGDGEDIVQTRKLERVAWETKCR